MPCSRGMVFVNSALQADATLSAALSTDLGIGAYTWQEYEKYLQESPQAPITSTPERV